MNVSMITHSRWGAQAFQDLCDPALHDKEREQSEVSDIAQEICERVSHGGGGGARGGRRIRGTL